MFQNRPASTRRTALAGLAALIVYAVMIFGPLAGIEEQTGQRALDLRPMGYSPDEVRSLFAALGPEGRALYLTRQLPLDLAYPALLAMTLSGLFHLMKRGAARTAGAALAWFAAFCDYAENAGIAALLLGWPDLPDTLVYATSLATVVKSVATSLTVTGLIVLGMVALLRWLRVYFTAHLSKTSVKYR